MGGTERWVLVMPEGRGLAPRARWWRMRAASRPFRLPAPQAAPAADGQRRWAVPSLLTQMIDQRVPPKRRLVRDVIRRGWLVCSCFSVGLALSVLAASAAGHMTLAIFPLAGPFAEPMARTDYSWVRMGVHGGLLLLAIGSHPLRPGPGTACVSLFASAWWGLTGFSLTYACV